MEDLKRGFLFMYVLVIFSLIFGELFLIGVVLGGVLIFFIFWDLKRNLVL